MVKLSNSFVRLNADITAKQPLPSDARELDRLPAEFHLIRPDEFIANKNHAKKDDRSIVLDFTTRFPYQPDWRAYPEALVRDVRLDGIRKDLSLLNMTDDRFWRIELAHAIKKNKTWRIEQRRWQLIDHEKRWDEHRLELEQHARKHFFAEAYKIMVTRERGHLKVRRLRDAWTKMMHAARRDHHQHDERETERLIKVGFARHAAFLAWRLDNLYAVTVNHSTVKVKGHGHAIEAVLGELLWDLRRITTHKHFEFRHDNLYVTHPNGVLVRLHHGGGFPLEHAAALVNEPKKRQHRAIDAKWHKQNNEITTPNGGLLRVAGQGQLPEAQTAKLAGHERAAQTEKHHKWRDSGKIVTLPNGGFTHAPPQLHAHAPEKVTADLGWADKRHVTHQHSEWRRNNLQAPTANGGFAPEKGHGLPTETVSFHAAEPKKEHTTQGFKDWHANHLAAPTPNHGIAPLKGHGKSVEGVVAQASDRPRQHAHEGTALWHATHHFKQTPNHGYAPMRAGFALEQVSADSIRRVKDQVTRRFFERRLWDRYVPTANGALRPLKTIGEGKEHVAAKLAPPSEGTLAADPKVLKEHPPTSEEHALAKKETQQRNVEAFRKTLAGHLHAQSQLHGHVVSNLEPVLPASNASVVPSVGSKKPRSV